ncbi:MAG TPA: hypothetical protein ENG66_07005 [Thermococcus sp.]|nr:hypothetical protein [Thermococcus sp.]
MLVRVNMQELLENLGIKEGEYPIKFYDEPDYEFIIKLNGGEGDAKLKIVRKNGRYFVEMDDELVKKIKLYDDVEQAAISLFSNEEFEYLKEDELKAILF